MAVVGTRWPNKLAKERSKKPNCTYSPDFPKSYQRPILGPVGPLLIPPFPKHQLQWLAPLEPAVTLSLRECRCGVGPGQEGSCCLGPAPPPGDAPSEPRPRRCRLACAITASLFLLNSFLPSPQTP